MRSIRNDLDRPHQFAAERVGFVAVKAAISGRNLILIAEQYYPVDDGDYIHDDSVGAMINQEAIRKALEIALLRGVGMFHVHSHEHFGSPGFSRIDTSEQEQFIPDFFSVQNNFPHGAIVLSHDCAYGRVWVDRLKSFDINEFYIVGSRLMIDTPQRAQFKGSRNESSR